MGEVTSERAATAEKMILERLGETANGQDCLMFNGGVVEASTLGNTQMAVHAIKDLMLDFERLMRENERQLLLVALETIGRAKLTHGQVCNGVHADNGMCEGESLHQRFMNELRTHESKYP